MPVASFYVPTCVALSFICFALSCVALFLPYWGFFEESSFSSYGSDRGYFGPFRVCKELTYDRQKCGSAENISRFRPSFFVFVSGIMVVASTVSLLIYLIISIVQVVTRKNGLKSSSEVMKLILSVTGGN